MRSVALRSTRPRVDALLTHLRYDPSFPKATVDWLERSIRRGKAHHDHAAVESWAKPPRHLERLREATDAPARLRALARSARELAEGAHREEAPLAGQRANEDRTRPSRRSSCAPVSPPPSCSRSSPSLGSLPDADVPELEDAIEAIEAATVARWRGPATGRVRIMSPYRARAARARVLFVASPAGRRVPKPSATRPAALRGAPRADRQPRPAPRRQVDEERYLFHACVSRPTERLYLSWQSCDEEGGRAARSPFIDEVST